MEVALIGIGTALPDYKRAQLETAELISAGLQISSAQRRLLRSVYKATGIHFRHSVLADYCKSPGEFEFFPNDPAVPYPSTAARMKIYKDNALSLALAAIQNCLEGLYPVCYSDITHLVTVSCTGMYAPGIDIEIVQALKLNPSVQRTTINFMGCYGAFNALKVGHAICSAQPKANVLIVCVEICTIHFQNKMDLDNIMSNSIFADGAAAVLLQVKNDERKSLAIESFFCDLLPQSQQAMTWHIGDTGFDITLSSYVPDIIQSGIAEFSKKILEHCQFKLNEVDFFAIHPGGMKILQACENALSMMPEQNRYSYQILQQYGNMSSATVLFILKEIWQDLTINNHENTIFSCAFGPGLTLESMLLRVNFKNE